VFLGKTVVFSLQIFQAPDISIEMAGVETLKWYSQLPEISGILLTLFPYLQCLCQYFDGPCIIAFHTPGGLYDPDTVGMQVSVTGA